VEERSGKVEWSVDDLAGIQGALILLVEDNELNQEVATGLLGEVGFQVDVAENGQVALDKLGQRDYDLVLMDMQMPVMDGVSATVALRQDPRWEKLPVVAMTANAMAQDREKCRLAGMNDYVAKPIDPPELFRVLRRWIVPRERPLVVTSPVTAEEVEVPVVEGLDAQLGLRRVLGKRALYQSMLTKFVSNQETTAEEIDRALQTGDRATAERLAHSAKGVSGNIGAVRLQELAGQLEREIREGEPLASTRESFAQELRRLIAALKAALPQRQAVAADLSLAGPVLQRLEALLASDDSEATECLEENLDLLQAALGADFARIEQALKQYDFEKALRLLRERT
jgi:CheY-like chemotaxis protein